MANARPEPRTGGDGDLSITALYTAGVWRWARLPGSELLDLPEARTVRAITDAALRLARPFDRARLREALVHRHVLIDRLLERSACHVVLELAAGLSARGLRKSTDETLRYVELDRPAVIARKRAVLAGTAGGRAALARPNLSLVSGDALETPLAPLVDGTSGPAMVIAEGLLMYLEPGDQRALAARVAGLLAPRGGSFAFDLVPPSEQPPPGLAGRLLGMAMRRFTAGRGFAADPRTREEIAADLRAAGFVEVEILEPARVARDYDLPFPDRPTRQLVFLARMPTPQP